jgi:type I restriction enzyme S subunit
MSWTSRTLGEICDEVKGVIQTGPFGSQLHESDYVREGVPVVMPKNIVDGRISTEEIAFVSEQNANRLQRHMLAVGDIVYGRRGDIGRRALITEREHGWLCGTGCLRVSLGNTIIDPMFLYYYLGESSVTKRIANQAIGATLPNLNTSILRSVPARYPSLASQRQIASILSAYDELIENNARRIKILEKMAQMIYREWFVNFRFPGHEKVKMIGSELGTIPQDWHVSRIQDFGQVITGKTPPKERAEFFGGEIPFIKLPDMHGKVFVLDTVEHLSAIGEEYQRTKTLPANSLCVSCIGTAGIVVITMRRSQTNLFCLC